MDKREHSLHFNPREPFLWVYVFERQWALALVVPNADEPDREMWYAVEVGTWN